MRPVPKLIESWYMPCGKCKGEGSVPHWNDDRRLEGCDNCRCNGHRLTNDGEEAMAWIYRDIKQRLEWDAFVAENRRKLTAKPDPEPELPFDPIGLSQYHGVNSSTLCWAIIGGIIGLAIHSWLGF